jgi:ATP-binding cassette subfamily B protein
MTLYLSIFRQGQSTFQGILSGVGSVYENSLFMANLLDFLELKPHTTVNTRSQTLPSVLSRGVEFRGVGFRYPDNEEWALRDINLSIRPGEKIALVGPNGAGKTTLIKLLSRLYDPNEGIVLIEGVDIREFDVLELRQKIGVIFQDFVRYHVPAKENVGVVA